MWLRDNSWPDIIADFSKTTVNKGKMRHYFEDSLNMNILNWKLNQKINSIRTWSLWKEKHLSKITSFLPLKFECANYIFPILNISFTFHGTEEYWGTDFLLK